MKKHYVLFAALLLAALLITPFVSESPDGLEASLEKLGAAHEEEPIVIEAPMPDYAVPFFGGAISGITAGIAGTVICLFAGIGITMALKRSRAKS